jgi:hypothetical protein
MVWQRVFLGFELQQPNAQPDQLGVVAGRRGCAHRSDRGNGGQ